MPLDPKTVARWTPTEWTRQVHMIRPSDGGAQGVLFVFCARHQSYSPALADFVVKPVSESAANTTVAERLIAKVAGAKTMESTPVKPTSALGKAILASAEGWTTRNAKSIYASPEPPYPWPDRLKEFVGHLRGAQSFLIQRIGHFDELSDVYRGSKGNTGFATVLRNATLMKNLGRLYVADAVLGNGDRFSALNTGNIAFDADGNVVAIDSAALLTKFSALLRDAQSPMPNVDYDWSTQGDKKYKHDDGTPTQLTREGWAKGTISGARSAPSAAALELQEKGFSPRVVATADLALLFDPLGVWRKFKRDMKIALTNNHNVMRQDGKTPPLPITSDDWKAGKAPFIAGVLDGMMRVDTMLSGLSWLKTKYHFKLARSKHGSDANLSWTNFKMRRIVMQHAARGKSLDEAYAAAEAYALRKTRGIAF